MENRRSIREFSNKNVSKEKLNSILRAGQLSPSGVNQKPFVYIVIDDPDLKKKIKSYCESADKKFYDNSSEWFKEWMKEKKISLKKEFLIDAPYLVIVAGETDKPAWLESTWISIAYVILAAEYERLATLTYTPTEFDFLYDLLGLPKIFKPVSIIPVGYTKNPK